MEALWPTIRDKYQLLPIYVDRVVWSKADPCFALNIPSQLMRQLWVIETLTNLIYYLSSTFIWQSCLVVSKNLHWALNALNSLEVMHRVYIPQGMHIYTYMYICSPGTCLSLVGLASILRQVSLSLIVMCLTSRRHISDRIIIKNVTLLKWQ